MKIGFNLTPTVSHSLILLNKETSDIYVGANFGLNLYCIFLGFCFGHLIHSGLLLGYQVSFLTSTEPHVNKCASIPTLVLDILYPTYSFVQLFFIFKYSNVIK